MTTMDLRTRWVMAEIHRRATNRSSSLFGLQAELDCREAGRTKKRCSSR
jgi:hypothetical protein